MSLALALLALACAPPADTDDVPVDDGVLRGELSFRLPLVEPERFTTLVGVDHDPVVQESGLDQAICLDYLGRTFPHCYDEHDGSDYMLSGGFDAMDAGSSPIVAAYDGVVVEAVDGNYDRCHGDLSTMENTCDGYPMEGNGVILEHADSIRTWYWHMKKDSVAVTVGDEVKCGDELGLVGSSGNSSGPHVHFEVEVDGAVVDPYAGPYSQEETWWVEQGLAKGLPGVECIE